MIVYTASVAEEFDLAIVGAGAAGLMAGIWAGRTMLGSGGAPPLRPGQGGPGGRIVILDGAKLLGAKILVAGGGRCNVTHDVVDERAFAGSSRHAIKKVLRRFDVPQTVEFFRDRGVELKREETGKLFPTTDKARTILDALLDAAASAGVELRHPWRVETVEKDGVDDGFRIAGPAGQVRSRSVMLATGGKSLPPTGSDGHGFSIARRLGHSITPRVFPALVPLTLPKDHFICNLSGLSAQATLQVHSPTGKKLVSFTDSTLCTHFGLSGPSVLDVSRYYVDAKMDDPEAYLTINWLPDQMTDSVDRSLLDLEKASCGRWLREHGLPQRLAEAICLHSGADHTKPGRQLTRESRRSLANNITQMQLPVSGDRGYAYAEVTAGGVPLSELHLETMESRVCPGLYIIGEICDVDGRIGGYNFQWAWASGFVAGASAASRLSQPARLVPNRHHQQSRDP
jgi:predicted Rossmann fold flavoprotein